MKVVDVGAAPGGWSQIIADKVESPCSKENPNEKERVIAVDLLEIAAISGVMTL
jgi:23S rRNA (uridine2552-2'-O)-methyltransferase